MHVWEKNKYWQESYELLLSYGILLNKKHRRKRKSQMLKRIKEFAKKLTDC